MRQLLGWASCSDIARIQVDFVSWFIHWRWSPPLVVVPRHVVLQLGWGCLCLFQGAPHPFLKLIHQLYVGRPLIGFEAHPW